MPSSPPTTPTTRSSSPLAGRRVLLGVSGGVAAYKAAVLARLLVAAGARVSTILTASAERFVGAATFAGLTGGPVHTSLWDRPDRAPHLELAHGCDLAIVAPATANTIARIAGGLADDLLSATLLETRAPILLAPAMHTGMWEHPATQANIGLLVDRGVRLIGPVSGPLAHGDAGPGRLAEPEDIVRAAEDLAAHGRDLAGRRIIVTAGPTYEPIDPVRFLGNRSSGRMGFAIAAEAWARGADVVVIAGPTTATEPPGPRIVRIETAEELRDAVLEHLPGTDVLVMAAAVADFRPARRAAEKVRREAGVPELVLEPTPDVLREVAGRADRPLLVGFAAETEDPMGAGRRKLVAKGVDLLVANRVGRAGTGFGSETNDAAILAADGDDDALRTWTKTALATALCDRIAKALAG